MAFLNSLHFRNGLSLLGDGLYDEAFNCFTEAIKADGTNVEAMKKRAWIHFRRDEFKECEIECDEILKHCKENNIEKLKNDANQRIPTEKSWWKILNVTRTWSRDVVSKAYRNLAKKFSTNNAKNAKLLDVDKKKLDAKMAIINGAKDDYENESQKF
jgi:hypothetical protein